MIARRRIGKVEVCAGTGDFDQSLGIDYADAGAIVVLGRLAFGVTFSRGAFGNPYGRLYLGVVEVEVYYERDGEVSEP